MATIYEIAKKAGVSPSTVARALRGNGYCSAENKEKILKIAQEMNYSPSYTARALKNKKTEKILFCIPDIYNPFYFNMIKGVSDVLEEYDYFPVLCYTKGKLVNELKMLQNLQEGYGDGMIMVSFDFNKTNIKAINQSKAPVVLTNHYKTEGKEDYFDCVYVDTKEGIYKATTYFIEKGYQNIAYIGGNPNLQTGRERLSGYIKALGDKGIEIKKPYMAQGNFSKESGKMAMERILQFSPFPDALVVANDLMAIGAITACNEKNIKVPEDIAVIGMDNSNLAEVINLSSVIMQEEEIGRQSAKRLMERIILEKKSPQKIIKLIPELAIRQSSEKKNDPQKKKSISEK